jgi:hypothetical protein
MATSTLVQYLETSGVSVSGAVVQNGLTPSNRVQFETFLCETAITKGQLVAVDVAKMSTDATGGLTAATVITADFIGPVPLQKIVVGVAAESVTGTATSPQPVKVVVRGPASAVPLTTVGCAVGDSLVLDVTGGIAGACMVNTAAIFQAHIFGYALETVAAAGPIRVYVLGCGI